MKVSFSFLHPNFTTIDDVESLDRGNNLLAVDGVDALELNWLSHWHFLHTYSLRRSEDDLLWKWILVAIQHWFCGTTPVLVFTKSWPSKT